MFRRLFTAKPELMGKGFALRLAASGQRDKESGIEAGFTFDIIPPNGRRSAGYVSVRLGESPELYYLGHIGYRVYEGYRGQGYAARAVGRLMPLMRGMGLNSIVITTDPDNMPSRKTCENLGCVLERVAQVPPQYQPVCMMSKAKCRYILILSGPAETLEGLGI
ncbi:MAG: GNAT family N-acetyltransferase [Eubacteriales bacterium]|nr:GNAT family N-acetyltransferase [Eubacteriales bacterium]MDD3571620.1 GNAT family N-acetyltransferase [Eubacteriales bacterium]